MRKFLTCRIGRRFRIGQWLISGLLLLVASFHAQGKTLTVDLNSRGGSLKKAGLGSLFGIVTNDVGAWKYYLTNSLLFVSEHQSRIGEGMTVPSSTSAVAPIIRGSRIRMMCRFGDLCYGWAPYVWPGLNNSWVAPGSTYSWLAQVTNAAADIKDNYENEVYAIAIFNEPEFELADSNFFNDPNIKGKTQEQRVNYVWTQTYRAIRSILPRIKIMGPNYEDYRPQYFSGQQTMMHDFLTNAIATGTVPDVIGWHNLNANPVAPGDIGIALHDYYRPLESSLGVPGAPLPVSIEEYGANNGAFEGIPGQMVLYWAEFERDRIDFADMGIYENGGDLGNTMRYTAWDNDPRPNAGWYMMNWYLQMQGQYVPVTRDGIDGVASWNNTNQTLTIFFGGADGDFTVQANGLGKVGLGSTVRVRLDMARWTTNSHVANTKPACGGDPQAGTYNIFDRNFVLDANGNLSVPVNAVEGVYNGYRLTISVSNAPAVYPTKYEAEDANRNHAILYHTAQASGGAYVGGIDSTDSFVCFHVKATHAGLYDMLVRYAANGAYGPASQDVSVNGQSQGTINYLPTAGWSATELRTVSHLVSLVQGDNDIMFRHATNYAELDYIDVRPDSHRYQGELATNNDVKLVAFNSDGIPDAVGGINNADSYVSFTVVAPTAGSYLLTVAYANGTSDLATQTLTVNGIPVGSISYRPTGGWFGGGWLTGADPVRVRQYSMVPVSLKTGQNTIQLGKGVGYAELDYVKIAPATNLTPARPHLSIVRNSDSNSVSLLWPTPATGYHLQKNNDLGTQDWVTLTNLIDVLGSWNEVAFPMNENSSFFRLYP